MTEAVTEVMTELKPCPFCGGPLTVAGGVNPYGRCDTTGCWMHERATVVVLDAGDQVSQWNTCALDPQVASLEDLLRRALPLLEKYEEECGYPGPLRITGEIRAALATTQKG